MTWWQIFWSGFVGGVVFAVVFILVEHYLSLIFRPSFITINPSFIEPGPTAADILREGLPGRLCGESWNLPDDERVQIVVTFGWIKRARAILGETA